jgi:hypothetical protein
VKLRMLRVVVAFRLHFEGISYHNLNVTFYDKLPFIIDLDVTTLSL